MDANLRTQIEGVVALSDAEYQHVAAHFTTKKLRKHQFLVQQNDYVTHEYFVVSGLLKSFFANESGKDHIVQFAMENWWVTDYQAFVSQSKALLAIDCIEDVTVLCLSFEDKQRLCTEMHKMEHFFRVKTTAGYVALQQRVLSFLHSDAKSRYDQLLKQYPALSQRVSKSLLASYLGVSRETLSRFSVD